MKITKPYLLHRNVYEWIPRRSLHLNWLPSWSFCTLRFESCCPERFAFQLPTFTSTPNPSFCPLQLTALSSSVDDSKRWVWVYGILGWWSPQASCPLIYLWKPLIIIFNNYAYFFSGGARQFCVCVCVCVYGRGRENWNYIRGEIFALL